MKKFTWLLALGGLWFGATQLMAAHSSADGILVVGTPAKVSHIFKGTGLTPVFHSNDSEAYVAVLLIDNKMVVYEDGAVKEILEFLGKAVKDGIVFTVKVGTELWQHLEKAGGVVVEFGKEVAHAICKILCDGGNVVVDTVKWVVMTSVDVLKLVADFLSGIIHSMHP